MREFNFLISYQMNLGPPNSCVFCGLVLESADHLFSKCHISIRIWKLVECLANIKINLVDLINNGQWLDFHSNGNSKFLVSIIVVTCWKIWKSRCNYIFNQENLDIFKTANLAILHVKEFSISLANHKMQIYFMQNRPKPGSMGIFLQQLGMLSQVRVGWVSFFWILMLMFAMQDMVQANMMVHWRLNRGLYI